jgi:uncharacterized membrane protein YphA (DoxX/SURF4 family)
MKLLRIISRFVLGFLFIFSGFVKALDPLGSAYKFSDYFQAFGLESLDSLSLGFGIFLAAFELVLGMVLLLGYQKKITYWVLLVFMSFFTVLTFILALTNPVTDCGCFGDAIIMTNWQTFFKNVIFMILVLVLFRSRLKVENRHSKFIERALIILFFGGSFFLSVHCLHHLPVIDFRPYDIGTYIPDEIDVPDGAVLDEYETMLYYRNLTSGKTEEFTIENYPQDTLNYSFVTSDSKLVKKGYEPPIHDFGIMDHESYDVTDEVLSFSGYSLFMISHDIEKVHEEILQQFNEWNQLERFSKDFKFIPVTASATSTIEDHTDGLNIDYNFYTGDEIMLKTMIRSNPGFLLLKNGTIIAKWAWRDMPAISEWNNKWTEVLQQYSEQQDPEIEMLIEEGFMEDLNWDLIDFDRSANTIVSLSHMDKSDRSTWVLYFICIVLLLTILQFLPVQKTNRRG